MKQTPRYNLTKKERALKMQIIMFVKEAHDKATIDDISEHVGIRNTPKLVRFLGEIGVVCKRDSVGVLRYYVTNDNSEN